MDAHTAADFILGLERNKTVENTHIPQIRRETSEHVANCERTTGTVEIVEKETATKNRNPAAVNRSRTPDGQAHLKAETEKILDGEVDGRRPP